MRAQRWSKPGHEWLHTWNAALVLSLEDTAVVLPLGHGGSFLPNLTGGISGQATRTERISFNESRSALRRDATLRCAERDTERYGRLGGRLGIADLFERAG